MKVSKKARWLVGAVTTAVALSVTSVALAAVTAGAPSGNSVQPTIVGQGNVPDCPSGTEAIKISPEHGTTLNESNNAGTVTVHQTGANTPTEDDFTFSFTVTGGSVAAVYVKASPDINGYAYTPNRTAGDTGLHAPLENGAFQKINHITYCLSTSGVLAATLRSVTATPSAKGVTVNWRTASEVDVAGYNVYGLVHGKRVKLNSHIIASKSSGANSYAFNYRTPKGQRAPTQLWLQAINLDGTRTMRAARIVH